MIATSKIITNQNQNLFFIKIGNEKICCLNYLIGILKLILSQIC